MVTAVQLFVCRLMRGIPGWRQFLRFLGMIFTYFCLSIASVWGCPSILYQISHVSLGVSQLLVSKGYTNVTLQIGRGDYEPQSEPQAAIEMDVYRYKSSLQDDMKRASLIISHGGTNDQGEIIFLVGKLSDWKKVNLHQGGREREGEREREGGREGGREGDGMLVCSNSCDFICCPLNTSANIWPSDALTHHLWAVVGVVLMGRP